MRIQDDVIFWATLCSKCDLAPYPMSVKSIMKYWRAEYHHTEIPISFYILYHISKPSIVRIIYKHKFMCVMKMRYGELPFTLHRHSDGIDPEDVFHTKIKPLGKTTIEEVEDLLVSLRLTVDCD